MACFKSSSEAPLSLFTISINGMSKEKEIVSSEKNEILVWENCLKLIRDNVNPQNFKTWFEPIRAIKLDQNTLTIEVPSQFVYEWLEEHYIGLLRKTIKRELGPEGRLEYS
ncbi:MAG: hypothetical protein RLZZ630_1142, partial [Bacteroidota bacterium]